MTRRFNEGMIGHFGIIFEGALIRDHESQILGFNFLSIHLHLKGVSQAKLKAGQSAKDFLSTSGILWGIECVLIAILRFQAFKYAYNYCKFCVRAPSRMLLLFATNT